MQRTALVPYARLPREHHDRHVPASTVDAFGAAHWLLTDRAPEHVGDVQPFDALVVSVHPHGDVELTELSAVRARWPRLDRLPDGGFVVAAARARRYEDADQVQVFDAFGGETTSFSIGDAVEHMLVDETGHIWAGHFDENPAGIRRWSARGQLRWMSDHAGDAGWIMDCYALNVSGTGAWACPYTDFPLLEIRPDRPDRPMKVRTNTVRGAKAVAVHGGRVAFYGGYGEDRDRLAYGELTETSVDPTEVGLLTLPDGTAPAAGGSSAGEAESTSSPNRSPHGTCSTSTGDASERLHSVRAARPTSAPGPLRSGCGSKRDRLAGSPHVACKAELLDLLRCICRTDQWHSAAAAARESKHGAGYRQQPGWEAAVHAGRSVIEGVASSVRPEEAMPARKLLQVMDDTLPGRSTGSAATPPSAR